MVLALVVLHFGVRLRGQAFRIGPPGRGAALQPGDLPGVLRFGLRLAGRRLGVQPRLGLLAADDLVGEPGQRHRAAIRARARSAVVFTLAEQRVLCGVGGLSLGEPRVHLSGQQRLQLGDLDFQLPGGGIGGHRRVRLHLGAIAGHHIHADQALPRTRHQRGHQQPLHRLLVPGHEPGHGGVIRMQVLRQHPRAHIVKGGHLDRPRRPDPLAIAVHDQAHHQPRMIGLLTLPISPVPGHKRRQVHPADLLAHRPRQMPSRQPLPRIRRQQVHLITAAATSEVVPHNHIFPGQSPFPRINTPT